MQHVRNNNKRFHAGCEIWRVTERSKRALEVMKMNAVRRSIKISQRKKDRDEIKQRMGLKGS